MAIYRITDDPKLAQHTRRVTTLWSLDHYIAIGQFFDQPDHAYAYMHQITGHVVLLREPRPVIPVTPAEAEALKVSRPRDIIIDRGYGPCSHPDYLIDLDGKYTPLTGPAYESEV